MNYVTTTRARIAQSGFALSKTSGRSMRPLIWGGAHCVVVTPIEGDVQTGDIIMFASRLGGSAHSVVHRVVEIRDTDAGKLYITRGDNCIKTETVAPADIIGRVAEVHRITGYRPWHIIPLRKFTVASRAHRAYARAWAILWPARRVYYALRERVNRIVSSISESSHFDAQRR